jgi:hypothetical protein
MQFDTYSNCHFSKVARSLVALPLMRKCQPGTGGGGFTVARDRRSGGFDKGRWPVRLSSDRAGFRPARISPMWAIARVPLSNPPRPRGFQVRWRPLRGSCLSRQPTGVGAAVAGAEACAVAAARAARWAALKPYRKFSHRDLGRTVLSRLMLDTLASLDA